MIVGKVYSASDLAYYNQGQKFPQVIVNNINNAIDSVLLPVMSSVQDDKSRVKSMTRTSIKMSTYIMAPMMMGLTFTADTVVSLLLTKKWLFCVPYLRIFCISYMFYPIHTANLNAMKAMGRSDLFLKLEILKKGIGVVTIIIAVFFGPLIMAYSMLVSSFISQFINATPNKKLMNYSYFEQIKDIIPSVLLAILMGCCTVPVRWFRINALYTLILQILVALVVYIMGSIIFKNESLKIILELLKKSKG